MKVKSKIEVAQSCPTLSDPMDYSLPGSPVPGILQARTLEWAIAEVNAIFMVVLVFATSEKCQEKRLLQI